MQDEAFGVIMLGGLAVLIAGLYLLGRYYPGSGAEQVDWRPTRSPELEAQNEIDDLDQMLEAANARRRRRGDPELTEQEMQDRVVEDRKQQQAMRDSYLEQEDVQQMLDAKNERRRRRGEPELSESEFRASVEAQEQDRPDAG